MATKKTPVNEGQENEVLQEAEPVNQESAMQAEIERLRAENEKLKRNSMMGIGARGSKTDWERVHEACDQATADGEDPWGITISVLSPRRPAREDPFYWLQVNGRSVQIPADNRYYDLKLPFAQIMVDMIKADQYSADFQDKLEVYDPVTNPKPN